MPPPASALLPSIDAVANYGIDQTGTVDVTALCQQALNDAGAFFMPLRVDFRPGQYLVSAPLSVGTGVAVSGPIPAWSASGGNTNDDYGAVFQMASYFGNPQAYSQPGVFYIDGNGTVLNRVSITDLWIEGTNGPAGYHGISAYGGAFHCGVSGVGMRSIPQDGLHTQTDGTSNRSDGWTVENCIIQSYGANPSGTAYGVNWTGQDTQFVNVHVQAAQASTTGGAAWYIQNGSNCRLIGCRGDQSGDCGFVFDSNPGGTSGTDSPGSSITMIGCGTENNYNYGVKVTNSSTTGLQERTPVLIVGCSLDFDGRGSPSGGGAAVRVEGNNIVEIIGTDVTTADNAWPTYGLVTATIGTMSAAPQVVSWRGGFINCNGASPVSDGAGINPYYDVDATVGGPVLQASTVSRYTSVPVGGLAPADVGFVGWTYDAASLPNNPTGVALPNGGVEFCWKVPIRTAQAFTNVRTLLVTLGSGLTTGENFIGVVSSAGVLIASSADMTAAWNTGGTTGVLDAPMSTPAGPWLATPPFVWIVAVFNGTTGPSFARTNNFSAALANGKAAATALRYATVLTGQTTLAGFTPSAMAATSDMYWGAVW